MDTISIKSLNVITRIGTYGWEKQILQPLLLDICIPFDFRECNDNLADTVDYEKICLTITDYLQQHSFQLIETVANQLAILLKEKFKLKKISITVHKPQAVKNAKSISVTAER